jgi:hypothetical protein
MLLHEMRHEIVSQEFHLVFVMRSESAEAREVQRLWFIAVCPSFRSGRTREREDSKFRHGIRKEGADE